jgi:drug/metabolite transporter (DMT)-like permease
MDAQRVGLVLLTGLAYGSSAVLSRVGTLEIPPLLLVMFRFLVAALGFALLLAYRRPQLPRNRRVWFDIILSAVAIVLPLIAFTTALLYVSTGVVTIIIALIPLFTGLIAHWWSHEPLNRMMITGLVLGLLGVTTVIATRTTGLEAAVPADIRWHLIAIGGAVISALGIIYTRRRLHDVDSVVVTAGQMLFAFLCIAPFALTLNTLDVAAVSARGWFSVVWIGTVGATLAFLLSFFLIKRYGATVGSLPGYIVPLVASLLGALLLEELIEPPLVIGGVFILIGVFLATLADTKQPQPDAPR